MSAAFATPYMRVCETAVTVSTAGATVTVNVADVLPAYEMSPLYTAVTVWGPALNPEGEKAACPALKDTGAPGVPPSTAKVTLPVGVPVPELGATVAVTIGLCPYTGFPVAGLVSVRLTILGRVAVPLSVIVCVDDATFRALSVNVTVPGIDPRLVGENVIFTLQVAEAARTELALQSVAASGVTCS